MHPGVELERRYLAGNYAPLPVVLTRGEGAWVWDDAGRAYLDMMSAYSAVSHGHGHPRLVGALAEQAGDLGVISRVFHHEHLGPFVARACELTGMAAALPMNTGSEAVETALKAARRWAYTVKGVAPDRARIVVAANNFHGRTIAESGMATDPDHRAGFGPFPPGFVTVPYGDADALEAAMGPDTAAFLVEPIQGEGGIVVPPAGYLAEAAAICRRHGVLLLADEVQTGLGRTGRLLACDHEGVTPDGLILGKALGGGLLPVSLFLARRDVMDVLTPGSHGSTFGGNPLAAAVGREALAVLVDEDLPGRAAELGPYLMARLRELDSPLVREVRGRGLLVGMVVDSARVSGRAVCEALADHGVLTKETREAVVRLAPPLTVSREELDWGVARIGEALAGLAGAARTG